jgi:hypothetical protein
MQEGVVRTPSPAIEEAIHDAAPTMQGSITLQLCLPDAITVLAATGTARDTGFALCGLPVDLQQDQVVPAALTQQHGIISPCIAAAGGGTSSGDGSGDGWVPMLSRVLCDDLQEAQQARQSSAGALPDVDGLAGMHTELLAPTAAAGIGIDGFTAAGNTGPVAAANPQTALNQEQQQQPHWVWYPDEHCSPTLPAAAEAEADQALGAASATAAAYGARPDLSDPWAAEQGLAWPSSWQSSVTAAVPASWQSPLEAAAPLTSSRVVPAPLTQQYGAVGASTTAPGAAATGRGSGSDGAWVPMLSQPLWGVSDEVQYLGSSSGSEFAYELDAATALSSEWQQQPEQQWHQFYSPPLPAAAKANLMVDEELQAVLAEAAAVTADGFLAAEDDYDTGCWNGSDYACVPQLSGSIWSATGGGPGGWGPGGSQQPWQSGVEEPPGGTGFAGMQPAAAPEDSASWVGDEAGAAGASAAASSVASKAALSRQERHPDEIRSPPLSAASAFEAAHALQAALAEASAAAAARAAQAFCSPLGLDDSFAELGQWPAAASAPVVQHLVQLYCPAVHALLDLTVSGTPCLHTLPVRCTADDSPATWDWVTSPEQVPDEMLLSCAGLEKLIGWLEPQPFCKQLLSIEACQGLQRKEVPCSVYEVFWTALRRFQNEWHMGACYVPTSQVGEATGVLLECVAHRARCAWLLIQIYNLMLRGYPLEQQQQGMPQQQAQ